MRSSAEEGYPMVYCTKVCSGQMNAMKRCSEREKFFIGIRLCVN